ncbi:hypothetical protein ACLMJK_000662 [Lecanora helva]
MTRAMVTCGTCKGKGRVYNPKDRCKKCKGDGVTQERKVLEVYIPRGAKEGEKIVLKGEADQKPDQEPGDIIFSLVQNAHNTFRRSGTDLLADFEITLAEALCGFSRVVVKHLDGRGIQIQHPQSTACVIEPGQVIKIEGEGMPYKRSDTKGDLYLVAKVKFPENGWLEKNKATEKLKDLLPKPEKPIPADIVDEVAYDKSANLEDFGGGEEGGGAEWEDEDERGPAEAQCAQQ